RSDGGIGPVHDPARSPDLSRGHVRPQICMAHRQAASVSILRRNITTNGRVSFIPAMLGLMLFAEFFLPRFALHLGQRELSVAAIVTFGCVAMLVLVGGLRPDP